MTSKNEKRRQAKLFYNRHPFAFSLLATSCILCCAIFLSQELSDYAKNGFLLSFKVIIPAVFPFLILTDFAIKYIRFERISFLKRAFERIFNISGNGISALICGLLCGFPIGARVSSSLYQSGKISKDECESLLAFSNNASPGYIISVIGLGIRGSLRDGILLYSSVVVSSIFTGIIIQKKSDNKFSLLDFPEETNYDFINSVKESINVCLSICGFVTAFSVLTGLIKQTIQSEILLCIILPFIEIGNACNFLANDTSLSPDATLLLTAFATAFSGFSVFAQTRGCINLTFKFPTRKYLYIKLVQALISTIYVAITVFLFKAI